MKLAGGNSLGHYCARQWVPSFLPACSKSSSDETHKKPLYVIYHWEGKKEFNIYIVIYKGTNMNYGVTLMSHLILRF